LFHDQVAELCIADHFSEHLNAQTFVAVELCDLPTITPRQQLFSALYGQAVYLVPFSRASMYFVSWFSRFPNSGGPSGMT
jgi:hypothetical protein